MHATATLYSLPQPLLWPEHTPLRRYTLGVIVQTARSGERRRGRGRCALLHAPRCRPLCIAALCTALYRRACDPSRAGTSGHHARVASASRVAVDRECCTALYAPTLCRCARCAHSAVRLLAVLAVLSLRPDRTRLRRRDFGLLSLLLPSLSSSWACSCPVCCPPMSRSWKR